MAQMSYHRGYTTPGVPLYGGLDGSRRRHRYTDPSQYTNQSQMLAMANSKILLYVNSPTLFRMVYINRHSKAEATVQAFEEVVTASGAVRRDGERLTTILNHLFGRSSYDDEKDAWYVSTERLAGFFRLASLRALVAGEPCYYIMASRTVKDTTTAVSERVGEMYRADPDSGNFMFPWAGIENRRPDPALFFALNRSPKAFEKFAPKFNSAEERQMYLPFSCTSFALEEKLNKQQGELKKESASDASGLQKNVFNAFLRKKEKPMSARSVRAPGTLGFEFNDTAEAGLFNDAARFLQSKAKKPRSERPTQRLFLASAV